MARRHRKRSRRYLGSRSCGAGNIKHRRGKGSRGGVGYAGSKKHKWTYIVKYEPDHFGRNGFVPPKRSRLKEINLWEINKMIQDGKVKEDGGRFTAELSGYKVLGGGKLDFPVFVKASAFSKCAVGKIKSFGGDAKVE